jgi:nucleoid-associated protein YgaU
MGHAAAPGSGFRATELLVRGRGGGRRRPGGRRGTASLPPTGRPVLRLVPPLPEPEEDPGTAGSPPADARNWPKRQPRRPVRLTRRGRVVVAVLLAALVAGIVLLLAAPGSAAPAAPPRTVVVHAGDTLWSLAARAEPRRPVPATMREIQRLNHMSDGAIYVGQLLLLPPAA